MRSFSIRMLMVVALVLAATGMAQAQANQYELNAHVGAFRPDLDVGDDLGDPDTDVMLGGRFHLTPGGTWGFGANFDWVNVDRIPGLGEDTSVSMYLYSGELNYTFPSVSQGKFFLVGGLGGRTVKIEDQDEDETRLTAPLGAGFKWLNDARVPAWAIRADIRDHLIFGDEDEGEDNLQNNWEVSGGVSYFF